LTLNFGYYIVFQYEDASGRIIIPDNSSLSNNSQPYVQILLNHRQHILKIALLTHDRSMLKGIIEKILDMRKKKTLKTLRFSKRVILRIKLSLNFLSFRFLGADSGLLIGE